ncbi:S1 family peptidase [Candidatus Phytoplasma pyri]|uniref:S1 family peptidase n=1 Tax=Candidatus Phytoplasma pyri TaxID=47566 RepID=UPI003982F58E
MNKNYKKINLNYLFFINLLFLLFFYIIITKYYFFSIVKQKYEEQNYIDQNYLSFNQQKSDKLETIKKDLLSIENYPLSLIFGKKKLKFNDKIDNFEYYLISFDKINDENFKEIITYTLNYFGIYLYSFISQKKYNCFELKKNTYEKGEILYSFSKDNVSKNILYKEGIISFSENNKDNSEFIFYVYTKGKENKFFFNQKGDFVGFQKKIFSEKDNQHFKFLNSVFNVDLILNLLPKNLILNINKSSDIKTNNNNDLNNSFINKKDFFLSKEPDLSKITVAVNYMNSVNDDRISVLGSGIIFKYQKIKDTEYEYYVLTNRHVVIDMDNENEQNVKNKIFYIKNKFFSSEIEANIHFYIDNNHEYDDLAVLKFRYRNNSLKKLRNINEIIDNLDFSKNLSNDFLIGSSVYVLCSQIQKIYNNENEYKTFFNLLKKGVISSFLEKEIIFDITIEPGNSGSPLFDYKGSLIGINKSSSKPNNLSQAININYIKPQIENIMNLKSYNNDKIAFLNPKDPNIILDTKKKIINFKNNIANNIEEKLCISLENIIAANIQELLFPQYHNILNHNNLVKFTIQGFNETSNFIEYDPKIEQLNIFFDSKNKEKFKYKIITEKTNFKTSFISRNTHIFSLNDHFEDKVFFILENIFNKNNSNLSKNVQNDIVKDIQLEKEFSQQKISQNIINSLVLFENYGDEIGIIIDKKKVNTLNKETYFVYSILTKKYIDSEYNKNLQKLKYFLSSKLKLKLKINNDFFEETGYFDNYFFTQDNKNLLGLIKFNSKNDYSNVSINNGELMLGENIYLVNSFDNKNFSSYLIKSNLSFYNLNDNFEKNNIIILDLPFEQPKMKKFFENKLNNFCFFFDHKGRLISVNNDLNFLPNELSFFTKINVLLKNMMLKFKQNKIFKQYLFLTLYLFLTFLVFCLQINYLCIFCFSGLDKIILKNIYF